MNNTQVLKDLTQTTYDSTEGYRKAANKAENPALQRALERRLAQRTQTLNKMNDALAARDEELVKGESTKASAHQLFQSISAAVGDSDAAVAERVEEGEDHIAEQFSEALNDDAQMDPSTRIVISSAYSEIREGEKFADMLKQEYT